MTAKVLFDFVELRCVQEWTAIDDRVMGGVSRSTLRHDPQGFAVFEGKVSLENGGGFASVRSVAADRGMPHATTCHVQVGGAPKTYKLSLLTEDGLDALNYQASFTPAQDAWQIISLPMAMFRASFRGREVPGARPLDPACIRQVGLMIAARQAGAFSLAIKRISLD